MIMKEIWNGWKIENIIGEGSFGKVYKITREDFGHTYTAALKVIEIPHNQSEMKAIKSEGMTDESVTTYFRSMVEDIVEEFSIMSQLKGNSNIVSYEDHMVIPKENEFGWEIYIRMEFLMPLLDYIENHGMMVKDVIQLGIDICNALEVCQRYDIIHRDIKPENIFVSDLGSFKLGDFGIARQLEKTMSGLSKKGTYTYMAPEVYKGETYSSSVDIYSLGIVMYKLLNNNRSPFMPLAPEQIKFSDREGANIRRFSGAKLVKPVNASEQLAAIILKACSYEVEDRYKFPAQMKKELQEYLNSESEEILNSVVFYQQGNRNEEKEEFTSMEDNDEFMGDEPTVLMSSDEGEIDKRQGKESQKPEAALNFRKKEESINAEKKKRTKIKIFIISIASVLLLALIITMFCVLGKNNTTKETISTSATKTMEKVYVPNVENMSMSEAVEILNQYGFQISVSQEVYSDNVEGGLIISQSPVETEAPKGTTIEVVLSKGMELVKVPYVIGETKSKAQSELQKVGFTLQINKEYSDIYDKGKVIAQSTESGVELKKGSKIMITVSKGKKKEKNMDVAGDAVYSYPNVIADKSDDGSKKPNVNSKSDGEKAKPTTKTIKKLGSYNESNVLPSGKINVLRNSLDISGSKNSEYTNLARYMANRGLSNASSTYAQLTNDSKNLKQKTFSLSVASSTNEDILEAAMQLSGKISTSKYGVGISSTESSVGYKIYIVVVYS